MYIIRADPSAEHCFPFIDSSQLTMPCTRRFRQVFIMLQWSGAIISSQMIGTFALRWQKQIDWPNNWGSALCEPLLELIPSQMHPLGCKNGLFGSFDIFGTQSFICRYFYAPNKSDISCYTHSPCCYRLAETRPARNEIVMLRNTQSSYHLNYFPPKAHGIIDGRFFEKSCHLCSTDSSTTFAEYSCVISSDGPGLWRSAYLAGRGILEHTIAEELQRPECLGRTTLSSSLACSLFGSRTTLISLNISEWSVNFSISLEWKLRA